MSKIKQLLGYIVLTYLRLLSKVQLKKVRPIIVGVTGSTGKTSLRDAVRLALEPKYKVKVTEKANSESGIPLDILDLHMTNYSIFDWIRVCLLSPVMLFINWKKYDVYVVEMGVDSPKPPKNMGYLLKIVKPHIGVLLNVSAVHSEQYDYLVDSSVTGKARIKKILELIADEKGKMLKSIGEEGFAIGNIDDENVKKVLSEVSCNRISFGKQSDSNVQIVLVNQHKGMYRVKFNIDDKSYTLKIKEAYLPNAYAYTFAGALAVAYVLRVDLNKAIASLSHYKAPPGRMNVFKGIKGSTLVDSSYNSSKLSSIEALNLVKDISEGDKSKVILALGDMREMGEEAKYEHEEIARKAVQISDRIVLVGPMMKKYFYSEALKQGFNKDKIFLFDKSSDAASEIKNKILQNGDVVLVKGSQNTIFMENIVEKLLRDKQDVSKLCRRGRYWDKMRGRYI